MILRESNEQRQIDWNLHITTWISFSGLKNSSGMVKEGGISFLILSDCFGCSHVVSYAPSEIDAAYPIKSELLLGR